MKMVRSLLIIATVSSIFITAFSKEFATLGDFAVYIGKAYDNMVDKKGIVPGQSSITDDIYAKALVAAERWWNEGTRTYSKQSSVSELGKQYQPLSKNPYFRLQSFLIDKDKVQITTADPDKKLADKYLKQSNNKVLFSVHPEIVNDKELAHIDELKQNPIELKSKAIPDWDMPRSAWGAKTVPTASSRAVIIDDPSLPMYVEKLHLPRKISRFYRNLGPTTIKHCVTVSDMLSHIDNDKFGYLPETIGIAFPTERNKKGEIVKKGWGFIIRELTPRPVVHGKHLLIPFFSLYADNTIEKDGEPLLVSLIKSSRSNETPKDYVLNHIIYPLIESWITVVKEQGVILESHGENTLLEVGSDLMPTRIIHKDLDNFVDCGIRKKLGLSCENLHPDQIIAPSEDQPKGSPYSLIFDSSISHHMLDYIAATMKKYFGVLPQELHIATQQFFQEKFPDYAEYFPQTIYYYAEKPSSPNHFALINTGKKPHWRPSRNVVTMPKIDRHLGKKTKHK